MKTYVLILSSTFPADHPRAGKETFFKEGIRNGISGDVEKYEYQHYKIHTIRSNYELWHKRIGEIKRGDAVISVRQWSAKPYRSRQVEICKITKDNNPGTQQVFMTYNQIFGYEASVNSQELFGQLEREKLAENDGLSVDEFSNWFFKRGKVDEFSGVIIHFTGFRY